MVSRGTRKDSTSIQVGWSKPAWAGAAAANLLFGDVSPGGKLPFSWPRTVGQVPMVYSHTRSHEPVNQARRYWDEDGSPLFPFGYGLSYGRFEYSNLGYAILGRVITAATGQAYPEFVRDRLLRPLGLTSSGFEASEFDARQLARGYRLGPGGWDELEHHRRVGFALDELRDGHDVLIVSSGAVAAGMPFLGLLAGEQEPMGWGTLPEHIQAMLPP